MKRLSDSIKLKIKEIVLRGMSLNQIYKALGINKTTVYYYFRKIKGRTYFPLNIKSSFSKIEGEIVGIFAGDCSLHFKPKKFIMTYVCILEIRTRNMDYM